MLSLKTAVGLFGFCTAWYKRLLLHYFWRTYILRNVSNPFFHLNMKETIWAVVSTTCTWHRYGMYSFGFTLLKGHLSVNGAYTFMIVRNIWAIHYPQPSRRGNPAQKHSHKEAVPLICRIGSFYVCSGCIADLLTAPLVAQGCQLTLPEKTDPFPFSAALAANTEFLHLFPSTSSSPFILLRASPH